MVSKLFFFFLSWTNFLHNHRDYNVVNETKRQRDKGRHRGGGEGRGRSYKKKDVLYILSNKTMSGTTSTFDPWKYQTVHPSTIRTAILHHEQQQQPIFPFILPLNCAWEKKKVLALDFWCRHTTHRSFLHHQSTCTHMANTRIKERLLCLHFSTLLPRCLKKRKKRMGRERRGENIHMSSWECKRV